MISSNAQIMQGKMSSKKPACECTLELETSPVKSHLWRLRPEYNWSPVAWSDYPKQPMWTVPLPKISAPVSVPHNEEPPRPRCQYPPAQVLSVDRCHYWQPDMPHPMLSTWNPFINEDNIPYSTLVGPGKRTKK